MKSTATRRVPRPLLPLFAVGLLTAAHPAKAQKDTPAFLDAPDRITVWMEQPTTPAAVQGHVSVKLGETTVPVSRVDVADADSQDRRGEVVLAGTFQSVLGGADWQPDGQKTRMTEYGPGLYQFRARLPRGHYQYKVARGGDWSDNYGVGFEKGAANIPLDVPADDTDVLFQVDFNRRTIRTSLETPGLAPFPGQPRPVPVHTLSLTLARPLGAGDIVLPITVSLDGGEARPVYARDVLTAPAYIYNGGDLGATYTRASTTFKVWSPVATSAELLLYAGKESNDIRRIPLRRGESGVWSVTVPGDLSGTYYRYGFTSYGVSRTAPDIYGRAASADLQRTMVVDLARTSPSDWDTVPTPHLSRPTDAIPYELHIRDFTTDPASGVPADIRGKYVGLIGNKLDYLRHLGITHVQVLPFQSIIPNRRGDGDNYSWGYATYLYDVPEPRYGTDPTDPAKVIRDVKTMVTGLHRAGIGIIMDVVYNHSVPSGGDASPFWATVPYYYFRTGPKGELRNESGVGNALADDRPMVRKYICDSLAYWASQYKVDGFRFDLLGMFTPETVRAISETLHHQRPDILLYGEPWTGGGPTRFGKGAQRGLGVAVFNDNFRGVMRGDTNGATPGFALGGDANPDALRAAISGSPDFTAAPTETINYVSIHDDTTLWDKIQKSIPGSDNLDRRALKLASAVTLLSQGIPVLEGGAELGRTKNGDPNSYNRGDALNRYDWTRAPEFKDVSDDYAQLIALRRAHPAFRCATAEAVRKSLKFLPAAPGTIVFTLDGSVTGDSWHRILVVFHNAATPGTLTLPVGPWKSALGPAPTGGSLTLEPLTAYVLYQK